MLAPHRALARAILLLGSDTTPYMRSLMRLSACAAGPEHSVPLWLVQHLTDLQSECFGCDGLLQEGDRRVENAVMKGGVLGVA